MNMKKGNYGLLKEKAKNGGFENIRDWQNWKRADKIGKGKIRAGIVALAVKLGPKLISVGVKLAKVAKVGKMGLAVGSMAAYVYLFTWQFAVLIMVSLFFHESGHIWAMKRCGLKTKGIYFIPFMGAAAVSESTFGTRRNEVYIAIMGPIWGFGLAIVTLTGYYITGDALYAAAAGWMAMLNLFNLLPISPLDGGRIMKSIAFSIDSKIGLVFLVVGIIASISLTFFAGLILFLILLLIGTLELFFEYREYEVYPPMTKKGIIISAIVYVTIIGVLWILMSYTANIPEVEIARKLFMS